jgi:ABC-type transport system involved in cytochrome bd biosynthesis fused ATPase/permease subunit
METHEKKSFRLDRGQIEVIDDKIAEIMKTKSGQERLNMVWDAWTFFEKTIRAYLKNRHPEWTEEQIQKEVVRRVTHGSK